MQEKKELCILSPFEIPDVMLALKTIKAGAFPILHLGRNEIEAKKELELLSSKTEKPFGVCIASEAMTSLKLPKNVTRVLLPFGTNISVHKNVEVLYQVHSLEEAETAIKNKAHSIVIKGNEGAGKVADETSFVLFQGIMKKYPDSQVNIYVQGGAGIHSSSAFLSMGAKGVIFDSQISTFPECSAPKEIKDMCRKFSGSETILIDNFRVLYRNMSPVLPDEPSRNDLLPYLGGFDLSKNYLPMGQDISFSIDLQNIYKNLKALVTGFHEAVYGHFIQSRNQNIIAPDSPLAQELGIKYPIAQGPMARISDVPEFLNEVAEGGALPFFALGVMTREKCQNKLRETAALLGDKPWGVGMLGFTLSEIRENQTKFILETKPNVVLIAGGRPALAKPFQKEGIKVFLHIPSLALLDMYLKDGARDFIFEGRESGGHVGPLSSLILWEKQITRLLEEDEISAFSVFFAGGIADKFSSAFVSIMAATLAARGAKIGVLMGTSYLYTKEAVKSGAIVKEYQKRLLYQNHTILLETGIGQESRSLVTPFTEFFEKEKQRMIDSGMDSKDILFELEKMNIGRLRIAAKGVERRDDEIVKLSVKEQSEEGLYLTGQVTALLNEVTTIEKLHVDVAENSQKLIGHLKDIEKPIHPARPLEIAIVGMEGMFPEAKNIDEYWRNLLLGKDCMTEVPDSRWNKDLFFRPDTRDSDYLISKWGGFIPTVDFDPLEFGITPQSLASIEPVQLLSLLIAKRALEDAGYNNLAEVDLDNTSVIFGAEGAGELASLYGLRSGTKQMFGELPEVVKNALPRLTADSFAGVLSNVIAGRIANRLNLGGRNFTVDAACASSLAALDLGCQELSSYRSDMVVLGGADLHNGATDFLMFGSTYALSKNGHCASFDSESDGMALGEGIGVVILKRLEDAERDGNKIYAVIKGVGGSSDGKVLGMTAPSRKGQTKALQRAYRAAGISPAEVGFIEAHGTGTVVGDRTELAALTDLFVESGAMKHQTYIGSVKTQIGHTKCAAGAAGLIKAVLSVHHGLIPPITHLKKPNISYDPKTSPFVFNTQPTIWNAEKRIAGISSFGFGGTNFHTIIENYKPAVTDTVSMNVWPSELFVFRGDNIEESKVQMNKVKDLLLLNNSLNLKDIAYSLAVYSKKEIQVSIVANSIEELLGKIDSACQDKKEFGIYYRDVKDGKVAFLFSGQGSQRVNMARSLFVTFPSMRRLLNENREYEKILFPEVVFDEESKKSQQKEITDTRNAQPLLGMVDWAIADFLNSLGIKPDMVAGHSYGELPALCFAGAFSPESLTSLSRKRAEAILNAIESDKGKMVAVSIPENELNILLEGETEVWAVNFNSTKQTVLAGTTPGMDAFMNKMSENKIAYKEINVACAFHSPLLAKAKELYADELKNITFNKPKIQVWSNTTAKAYPKKADEIKERLSEHLVKPVLFTQQIQNMFEKGARIFIETGPGRVLIGLAQTTLGDDITVIQTENKDTEGVTYLLKALAQYLSTGKNFDIEKLFNGREVCVINIDEPDNYKNNSTLWRINGHNAVPVSGKMPVDGAYPITQPLILLNDMQNDKNNVGSDRIMLEYLESMKALIQNQESMIQNQRDVMLGYLGQYEVIPRAPQRPQNIQNQQNIEIQEAEIVEGVPQVEGDTDDSNLPHILSLSNDEIKNILLEVVSEKTGYPIDMLGMDVNLEADLSIDSIKRMEIIGSLRERMRFPEDMDESEDIIEKIASIKTLNELMTWIEEIGNSDAVKAMKESGDIKQLENKPQTVEIIEEDEAALSRICFDLTAHSISSGEALLIEGQRFALTNDEGEFAVAIKDYLETKGAIVDIVKVGDDLKSYNGLILLNASGSTANYTIKDLFQMIKSADMEQLKWVYTFSDTMTHILESEDTKVLKNIQGFPGLLKSLTHEYPDINFRIVDSYNLFDVTTLPEIVENELSVKDWKHPEIIYKDAERLTLEPKVTELVNQETTDLGLDKDSVVLVLGGAQGITPGLISQLGAEYPCQYVLVGRSSQLTEEENQYSSLKTKDEIRQYLIHTEHMKVPKEIEAKLQSIFKSNQINEALNKVAASGAKVTYKSADIKNSRQFKSLIKDVRKEYGKIDGVIHAAAILDDKLFNQKTWKSFEQVYLTKVTPLHIIFDELLPDLKFLILFSSASSAFGNKGQTDYAAGNSVFDLTSLAFAGRKAETRVLSFNWGPWKGAGMVSASLENEFKKRGVSMIPLQEGGSCFVNELKYGKEPAVMIMGGGKSIEKFLNEIR